MLINRSVELEKFCMRTLENQYIYCSPVNQQLTLWGTKTTVGIFRGIAENQFIELPQLHWHNDMLIRVITHQCNQGGSVVSVELDYSVRRWDYFQHLTQKTHIESNQ